MSDLNNAPRDMLSAVLEGNAKRVGELLDWGVDPSTRIDGHSLLQHSCGAGHHMVAKALIRAGAQADREALVMAIGSGNRHCATYVADDLHFQGEDPFSFSWVTLFADPDFLQKLTPELARWLVRNGLDLNETDSLGRNLIELASSRATEQVLNELREKSAL